MTQNKILSFIAGLCLLTTVCASAQSLYVFESTADGFNTKNFFYDNGEEVVAFDSQFTPEIAEKSIAFLRSKTSHPITYLVITHPNPDKFNGMLAFQKLGVKVIASRRTADNLQTVHDYKKYFFVNLAKMFTENTYPQLQKVDRTFKQNYHLRLANGETINLHELSHPGVSSNQTIAYIPKLQTVLVGDLIHHRTHAWLEGGITGGKPTPTLTGWIADLKELAEHFKPAKKTIVYGGRGESALLSVAVKTQIEYLKKADQIVNRYLAQLTPLEKAELQSEKAAVHYKNLKREFEQAFPHYSLSYLIEYGIYGLVKAKL